MTSITLTPRAEREQRVFRTLLTCMSRPGTVANVLRTQAQDEAALDDAPRPPSEGGRGSSPLSIPAGLALLESLVDHEVTFCVFPERNELSDAVLRQTGSRLAPLGAADYVLCDSLRLPEALRRCKEGTLEYPDRGATVVCMVDSIASAGDGEPLLLAGPGIKDRARVWVEGFDAEARAAFAERNAGVPLGVDVVFVAPDGAVCCLTRYTRLINVNGAAGADEQSSPTSIKEVP